MSSKALAISEETKQSMDQLESIIKESTALENSVHNTIAAAVTYALMAQQLEAALTPKVMAEVFMPLKGKDFGWTTDEPPGQSKYGPLQLSIAWVSALFKGALPFGGEVLIISGRPYLEKPYFTRMLRNYKGLTEFVWSPGKVEMKPGGALVEATATWKLNGTPMSVERTGTRAIPIRLNNGQGADAALGKAERKIKAQVLSMITGSTFDDADTTETLDAVVLPNDSNVSVDVSTVIEGEATVIETTAAPATPTAQPKAVTSRTEEAKSKLREKAAAKTASDQKAPVATATNQTAPAAVESTPAKNKPESKPDQKVAATSESPLIPSIEPQLTGEIEESTMVIIDAVKVTYAKDADDKPLVRYKFAGDSSDAFYTYSIETAKAVNSIAKTGKPMKIKHQKNTKGDLIIIAFELAPEEPAADDILNEGDEVIPPDGAE